MIVIGKKYSRIKYDQKRFEKDLIENPWKAIKKFCKIYGLKHRLRRIDKEKFNKKFNYKLLKFEFFVYITKNIWIYKIFYGLDYRTVAQNAALCLHRVYFKIINENFYE